MRSREHPHATKLADPRAARLACRRTVACGRSAATREAPRFACARATQQPAPRSALIAPSPLDRASPCAAHTPHGASIGRAARHESVGVPQPHRLDSASRAYGSRLESARLFVRFFPAFPCVQERLPAPQTQNGEPPDPWKPPAFADLWERLDSNQRRHSQRVYSERRERQPTRAAARCGHGRCAGATELDDGATG
jgi:hypothetical protein